MSREEETCPQSTLKVDFDEGTLVVSRETGEECSFVLNSKLRFAIPDDDHSCLVVGGVNPKTERPFILRLNAGTASGAETLLDIAQKLVNETLVPRTSENVALVGTKFIEGRESDDVDELPVWDEFSELVSSFDDDESVVDHLETLTLEEPCWDVDETSTDTSETFELQTLSFEEEWSETPVLLKSSFGEEPSETPELLDVEAFSVELDDIGFEEVESGVDLVDSAFTQAASGIADFSELVNDENVTKDFSTVKLDVYRCGQVPTCPLKNRPVEEVAELRLRGFHFHIALKGRSTRVWNVPTAKVKREETSFEVQITAEALSIVRLEDDEKNIPLSILRLYFADPDVFKEYQRKFGVSEEEVEEIPGKTQEELARQCKQMALKEFEVAAREFSEKYPLPQSSKLRDLKSVKSGDELVAAFYESYLTIHQALPGKGKPLSIRDFRLTCAKALYDEDFCKMIESLSAS